MSVCLSVCSSVNHARIKRQRPQASERKTLTIFVNMLQSYRKSGSLFEIRRITVGRDVVLYAEGVPECRVQRLRRRMHAVEEERRRWMTARYEMSRDASILRGVRGPQTATTTIELRRRPPRLDRDTTPHRHRSLPRTTPRERDSSEVWGPVEVGGDVRCLRKINLISRSCLPSVF